MEQDSKKLTRAHKVALGIISAVCCCVIGISAFALAAPDILSEQPASQTQQAEQSEAQEASDGQASEEATGESSAENGNEDEAGSSANDNNAESNSDSSNVGGSKSNASSGTSNNKASSSSSSKSSNITNGSSNGGSSSSSSSSGSSSTSDTVTVSVSVSSSTVGGRVSGSAHPTFKKGATAYDALCATGLAVSSEPSAYGIYVTAIGGLARGEYGGNSGWMYSVNGVTPNFTCGKYKLKDGDSVSWFYVK